MTTSKSPRRVLQVAYDDACEALPAHRHKFSPKKFTQHQLLACLVLKEFLRTDYRGLAAHLADHPDLCRQISLGTVPHFTTFQKAAARLLAAVPGRKMFDAVLERALRDRVRTRRVPLAAVDGTGLESRHTSRYYVRRRSRHGDTDQVTTYATCPKVVFVVDCRSHMILAAVPGRGPGSDLVQLPGAVRAGAEPGRRPRPDRCAAGRRRFRCRVGPPQHPVAWHPLDHPAGARAALRQASVGPLAEADEAAVRPVQAEVRAKVAGGDGQLDDQAAARLGAAGAEVREPVPRDHPEGHYT